MARRHRLGVLLLAALLIAPASLARVLTPDPAGHGTHRQLGFPPCTMVFLFGVRCPACGMTTAWSNVMHGQWAPALRANVTGAAFCVGTLITAVWLAASGIWGGWLLFRPTDWHVVGALTALLISMLAEWMIRVLIL